MSTMRLYGKRWPEDFTHRFFLGQHIVDRDQNASVPNLLKGIRPREIVRQLADAGCDLLYFYMSCHLGNCYYPTKVKYGRVHSGMGKRDVFGEVADECVKRKIALFTVYEFSHLHYAKDWARAPRAWKHYRTGKDGSRHAAGLCWNTGYGEFVLAQIDEIFSRYPTFGLYVDMLDYPGLNMCPECRRRFQEELGAEPPTQAMDVASAVFKEYKMWTFREEARFLREIRRQVRAQVPSALVMNNFHRLKCEDLYEVRDATDVIGTDPGIGFGYQSTIRATQTALCFRALSEDKPPFDILYDDIVFGQLAIAPRDPYLSVAATALAHGGYPTPDCMWARDGSLNPAALGLAREVYRHVDSVNPWIRWGHSLKAAGVYLSQESEYFYGHPGEKDWSPPAGRYLDEFQGALMMLQEEHVPTDVLTRHHLGRLSKYPAIYLPNAVCLSALEVQAFRDYVKTGGTLVASYRTSLANEWGCPGRTFQLADVFGVDGCGEKVEPFLAVQMNLENATRKLLLPWENPSVSVNQSALVVKARRGAQVLAWMHDRYRPNADPKKLQAFHNALVVEKPFGPGIVVNRYGRGKSIYFAGKIFGAYAFSGMPELRKLAARWLVAGELKCAPVRLAAPHSVEMTAFARPAEGRWIIHLVNIQSVPGRAYFMVPANRKLQIPLTDEVIPVHDLVLQLHPGTRAVRQVRLQPGHRPLAFRRTGADVSIRIPKVHLHAVVEVEFKAPWSEEPESFAIDRKVPMIRCTASKTGVGLVATKKQAPGEIWNGKGAGQE